MMIPHIILMLDSQMEGLNRHKRTLLAGYDRKKVNPKNLLHLGKTNFEQCVWKEEHSQGNQVLFIVNTDIRLQVVELEC